MKHKKIKIARRKRKTRMAELYQAKCDQLSALERRCRAQETSIHLLRKVIDDAQEQRNELELQIACMEQEIRDLRHILRASRVCKR
jgi:septal ring factor EnvC (AmiA/AmiB activator)